MPCPRRTWMLGTSASLPPPRSRSTLARWRRWTPARTARSRMMQLGEVVWLRTMQLCSRLLPSRALLARMHRTALLVNCGADCMSQRVPARCSAHSMLCCPAHAGGQVTNYRSLPLVPPRAPVVSSAASRFGARSPADHTAAAELIRRASRHASGPLQLQLLARSGSMHISGPHSSGSVAKQRARRCRRSTAHRRHSWSSLPSRLQT